MEDFELKTEYIQMRTTKEVKKQLRKIAREDNRTMSTEVEYLIKKELKLRESEDK
jgi:hypothetical protein